MLPVLLSFALQVIYILLPLIPAVLIYKWFPTTKVSAEGKVTSNWTVKAGGAFAAYIVTVLLGYFLADGTQKMIQGMSDSTWTVVGHVELQDADGKPVADADKLIKAMQIEVHPDFKDFSGQRLLLRIPVESFDPSRYAIHITIPEFAANDVSFDNSGKSEFTVKPDYLTKTITIRPNIVLRSFHRPQESLAVAEPTLTPLPKNAGPPPVQEINAKK
jgi:hypothetical protein